MIACASEVEDPNAPCAADLNAKLDYDCRQTVQCKTQRGEIVPTVAQCTAESAPRLTTAEGRDRFLRNHGRCADFTACSYTDCAATGAFGFGEMQAASIMYNCQQTLACNAQKGVQVCSSPLGLSDCVSFTTGRLNGFPTDGQQAYVAAQTRCMGLVGCAFVSCASQ